MTAVCPCCEEEIGLSSDESLADGGHWSHGEEVAFFTCHVCQSSWSVFAEIRPRKTIEDE